jgi:hypothetical protein
VAIAVTLKGSWYLIGSTKEISEILTVFIIDVEAKIDVLDQETVSVMLATSDSSHRNL